MRENSLTLGSLFDGSGGFPLGGILAGITPVWASEIEPFPIRVTTKRLPFVKHYGNVSTMNGGTVEPVDIITFGSPCQDMSIAGKRAGLDGSRSSLFYEAARIIKEMREATNGRYPRWLCWENVPGALSSNDGADFQSVLAELCSIKGYEIHAARPARWKNAGEIVADDFSLAWRVLDASLWGVPQRRKRVYLVADLAGRCAGKVLFESEGLSGYSAESFRAWQRTACGAQKCIDGAGGAVCLNDQGGERMDVSENISGTLRAETHGHLPIVAAGFCTEHSSKSRSIGYEEETSPTLRAGVVPAAMLYENHAQDCRYGGPLETATTITANYGMGGNNTPLVVNTPKTLKIRCGKEGGGKGALIQDDRSATLSCNNDQTLFQPKAYGICSKASHAMLSDNPHSGFYEADSSRTLDQNGGNPNCNQGGVAVVQQGKLYTASKASFFTTAHENVADTLVATDYKDPPLINDGEYIVRRLTPIECARLQGFPDWWCDGLGTDAPTDEDIAFWEDVFETHRKVVTGAEKPKSRVQIVNWLRDPYLDGSAYKMWGNGVALPCVWFVLSGIAYFDQITS